MLSERTSATTASRPAFTRASDNFGLSLETSAALPGSTVRRWYKSHALEPGGSTRRFAAIASSTLKINGDGAAALLGVLSGTPIAGGARLGCAGASETEETGGGVDDARAGREGSVGSVADDGRSERADTGAGSGELTAAEGGFGGGAVLLAVSAGGSFVCAFELVPLPELVVR